MSVAAPTQHPGKPGGPGGQLPWAAESGLIWRGSWEGRETPAVSHAAAEVAESRVYLSGHIFPLLVKASSGLLGPATGNCHLHRPEHGLPGAGGLLAARSWPLPHRQACRRAPDKEASGPAGARGRCRRGVTKAYGLLMAICYL